MLNLINKTLVMATANPYMGKINELLTDMKGWILALVGGVTVVIIAVHGMQYQKGSSDEKAKAVKDIRGDILMGGGIFILVWFGSYVVEKMQ